MEDKAKIWLVYDGPPTHPGMYVACCYLHSQGEYEETGDVIVSHTLSDLREVLLDRGYARVARTPAEDVTVVECWV